MTDHKQQIRIGIIGLGGFAFAHHTAVHALEKEGECRLICTCDPNVPAFGKEMARVDFAGRGVRVFDDYRAMLKACRNDLDMIVVPTPVPLHAEMHKAGVEAELAVYLEKPPTLNYAELEEMLAVESKAKRETLVGFNYIVEKPRQAIKKRLLHGEFGAVQCVSFTGLWPRSINYFQRAQWAGRLIMNGKLVLDFAMGNAMAHHIHNLLFWAGGKSLFSWANIIEVESQLYRAHQIEGTDTVFVRAQLEDNIELKGILSHACDNTAFKTCEQIICERAVITWTQRNGYLIEKKDGTSETIVSEKVSLVHENHREYYRYLRGEVERPLTRLANCIPFVQLCDLTYVAAGEIHAIPEKHIERKISPENKGETVSIIGLAKAAESFIQNGNWPETPAVPWAKKGGKAALDNLSSLSVVIAKMAVSPAD